MRVLAVSPHLDDAAFSVGGTLARLAIAAGLDARMSFQRRPSLVPAHLGADAGVIGAGLVAWDLIREDVGP